jgi:hypothetical protein
MFALLETQNVLRPDNYPRDYPFGSYGYSDCDAGVRKRMSGSQRFKGLDLSQNRLSGTDVLSGIFETNGPRMV